MANEYYGAFIEEAFIKPIRSVLIVDDDYPTFDEMLDAEVSRQKGEDLDRAKGWYENPDRIKKVIAKFRSPGRPLLVDIHDGTNVTSGEEIHIAAHLHQSDLLVLDYELDRTKKNDGSLAIEILKKLTTNNHFNLVVVHTSEDLETVFRQALVALLSPLGEISGEENDKRALALLLKLDDLALEAAITNGSEEEPVLPSLKFSNSIGIDQYIYGRQLGEKLIEDALAGKGAFSGFFSACEEAILDGGKKLAKGERKVILRHLLSTEENKIRQRLNNVNLNVSWNSDGARYIACDSMFVAFTSKGDDDDLLADLLEALNAWRPQPSHLVLAKLRAEMDDRGVLAQNIVLNNKRALAHWYHRLLAADGEMRRWMISESVVRHSDQLMAGILPSVDSFASRLVKEESARDTHLEICGVHYGVDLSQDEERFKSELEHNAYVSSKSPQGWHLTTGHVFQIKSEYWVCVSPACDTVPAQISSSKTALYGDRLPFMAVKLHSIKDGKRVEDVQSNRYIFLRIGGQVKSFCYNDPVSDNSAPIWHQLLAEKKGVFGEEFTFQVLLPEKADKEVIYKPQEAKVVAQLRYEYALNFVQRLGGTMTRIGLDYV